MEVAERATGQEPSPNFPAQVGQHLPDIKLKRDHARLAAQAACLAGRLTGPEITFDS